MLGRGDLAYRIFSSFAPPKRGQDPELYTVEPYVTPGNVDGPESPTFGRGGWTWYSGSSAWLHRVCTEWILGVRPDWDGLVISPCLPTHWNEAHIVRPFRGDVFEITLRGSTGCQPVIPGSAVTLDVDGLVFPAGTPIPASGESRTRHVTVHVGNPCAEPAAV
jgi:cellobiose phosphorylase